ncbi:MAG: acetate/propionate family kinase [Xanthomonadales bacterium]|jgi:acetate kinase|nr:acetate/propionate family kinase [Xanthomonadales bacterium]
MDRSLLALNVGSTTLKAAIYDLDATHTLVEYARAEIKRETPSEDSLAALLEALPPPRRVPDLVIHRIVHGGTHGQGRELDDTLLAELDNLSPLAPLHQPIALELLRVARARWPDARHGVAFDTSFHASLAPWSRRLSIPAEWDAMGIRRYGFHGLAFTSALRTLAGHDLRTRQGRVVLAHLGGGCSVCAVENGLSRDTTMALTPLGGIPGPTRSGDLDPGVLLYLLRHSGLDADAIEYRLSHHGGLAAIAGHGDMRLLIEDDGPAARLALEVFVVRIAQAIAAMATGIGGLDHLVFSGGIGHRAPVVRERIFARLAWLGLIPDTDRNNAGALRIDRGMGPGIWNVQVDEERELAESAMSWI